MQFIRLITTLSVFTASLLSADTSVLIAGKGGLYRTSLNHESGQLSNPELIHKYGSGSWLVHHPSLPIIYSSWHEGKLNGLKALRVDSSRGITEFSTLEIPLPAPAHVAVNPTGSLLATANWGGEATTLVSLNDDGSFAKLEQVFKHQGSGPRPVQTQARPHFAGFTPDGAHLHVTDLGADEIWTYPIDHSKARLALAHKTGLPSGSGPRHLAFSPDQKFAYVSDELSHHVSAFEYDEQNASFATIQHINAAPAGMEELTNNVSEVLVHPSGRFVYTANRGNDSLAALARDQKTGLLTLVEIEPARGVWPRNFNITSDGKWMIAASQISGTVAVFSIDQESGKLTYSRNIINVPAPVRVLLPKE